MKKMVITGHKSHEIGLWSEKHPAFPYLKLAYQNKIRQAIEEAEVEWFLNSGAQGLELYAAEWLLEMRKEYPAIKLAMLLPFYNQEKQWKDEMKERYGRVLALADFVDYISKKEYTHPWQLSQKNRYLVQQSDGLLTFFNGMERTHPWYYLQEARQKQEKEGYTIWVMDPDELQELVDEMSQRYD